MAHKHDEFIELAQELISEEGEKVQWEQTAVIENTEQRWKATNGDKKVFKPDICFVPVTNKEWRKMYAALKGTEVVIGKTAGLMAGGQKFVPSLKDVVIRGTQTLTIADIDVIQPADKVVLYIIEFNQ